MSPEFEIGIQLHLPTFRHVTLREFIAFGHAARAGGVSQLWVTDNLRSRNPFVVLTALAASVPIKLGTAITVRYFRSLVDVAEIKLSVAEDGRAAREFARHSVAGRIVSLREGGYRHCRKRPSFRRRPESRRFKALDSGVRQNDELKAGRTPGGSK